jgi:hypothetical protein
MREIFIAEEAHWYGQQCARRDKDVRCTKNEESLTATRTTPASITGTSSFVDDTQKFDEVLDNTSNGRDGRSEDRHDELVYNVRHLVSLQRMAADA